MESGLTANHSPRKETGFVGFFDILGYKSFLESGISEVTFKLIDILDGLQQRVSDALNRHFGADAFLISNTLKWELDRIIPLVVSDSILLRSSYDENRDLSLRPSQAATFLVAVNVLTRDMFEHGLPLRAAVAFGECIFHGHVFAGKPIADAYVLGHSLNLAACATHETAENEFKRLLAIAPEWHALLGDGLNLVRYPAPIKGCITALESLCLNAAWPTLRSYTRLKERMDIRQYVREQFSAHNKRMVEDAIAKADNTEAYLRFLQGRFPHLFYRDP